MDSKTKQQVRDLIVDSRRNKALNTLANWAEKIGGGKPRIPIPMPTSMSPPSLTTTVSQISSTIANNALKTILFMGANPPDTRSVQIEVEHSRIASELDNKFNLEVEKFLSAAEIPKLITEKKPHIIHFSGHGKDPESSEHGTDASTRAIGLPSDYAQKGGIVVFDDDMRQLKIIEDDQLEYIFKTVVNSFKIPIEVAVFNSCYSESQAKVLGKYIPYVVGSSRAIEDNIAIAFAAGFYYGIGAGQSIEDSFLQGKMQAVLEDVSAKTLIVLYKNGELQDL